MTDERPLTGAEIARLRSLLSYADEIERDMEYKAARRLIIKTWRGLILGLAGLVGAFIVLNDAVKQLIRNWLG